MRFEKTSTPDGREHWSATAESPQPSDPLQIFDPAGRGLGAILEP
jgi:hypothetical protein